MIGEILGGLVPAVGKMIGGAGQSAPQAINPEDFLNSYLDTMQPIWDDEGDYIKSQGKKTKKKTDKYYEVPKAEQARLQKEIARNYDTYTDSLIDAAMRGEITGDEALGKFEELEALGLFNPGSVINDRGDTSFSKKVAAEKKILEEINPRQRLGNATVLANSIMGRELSDAEKRYYTDATMFKSPEDVAAAMRLTEEGDTRFVGDPEIERNMMKWGGRIVNPTAKNADNLPHAMRITMTNPAEAAMVTQQRVM